MAKKQVLGKGIHALIPEYGETSGEGDIQVLLLPIDDIEPNPHQPRLDFDEESLRGLMRSIQEKGVIQPVSVNRSGEGYHLIAGERRWRAARMAGMETIPAIVHEIDSTGELMELSLIENIQREDLNPIEEAQGYRELMDTCLLTQEDIARKVGRDRSTIANTVRLLKLPEELQNFLRSGQLQMGHARALVPLDRDDALELGHRAVSQGMTVRDLERAARKADSGRRRGREPTVNGDQPTDPLLSAYEERLRHFFATSVGIRRSSKKGRIEIEFYDDGDLERILELLLRDE